MGENWTDKLSIYQVMGKHTVFTQICAAPLNYAALWYYSKALIFVSGRNFNCIMPSKILHNTFRKHIAL